MNKDVIYIEPEDDITDILVNIKATKNKIVALVPPKKASVLRSAVNFKLITKTAAKLEKTVVLITSDESLLRLANNAKMPTSKSLQSKPHLPDMDDAEEFGENDGDDAEDDEESEEPEKADDAEAEDDAAEDEEATEESEEESKEEKKESKKSAAVAVPVRTKKKPDIDMEIDGEKEEEAAEDNQKKSAKKKIHIPNFKKFRWPILIGVIILAAIIAFSYWASNIAPAAMITVKVKTTASNFNETVSFVTDQTKSDPAKGIFYAEQKTVTKQATDDFEATGEVDKGTKATGSITVKVKSPAVINTSTQEATYTVPAGTEFTNSAGNKYVSSAAVSLRVTNKEIGSFSGCKLSDDGKTASCALVKDVTADVQIVAVENGEKYNFTASTTGWSFPINAVTAVKASDITGGTSKIVKIVSAEDVDKAGMGIANDIDNEAREELSRQFSGDYILISSSFATESTKITTSPAVNEEVTDGVTPKIIKENKYVIYAVNKTEVDTYIKTVAAANLGDDTQIIYSTGVAMKDGEENKAFFESFKNDNGTLVAKLKSSYKTGPRITEDMVKSVSLGEKVGRVQSNLRSYKGVLDATVKTSYFFVTTVPEDENKVKIEITVD